MSILRQVIYFNFIFVLALAKPWNIERNSFKIVNAFSNRIYGGQEARPGQFPYQVSLRLFMGSDYYIHICSASILSKTFLITAAHCLRDTRDRYAVVGVHTKDMVVNQTDLFRIKRKIIHEKYSQKYSSNDIALLELDRQIEWRENVRPIDENVMAIVSG